MMKIADNVHESQLYDFPLQRGKQSVWTPTAKGGWSQTHLFFSGGSPNPLTFSLRKEKGKPKETNLIIQFSKR